MQASHSVKYSHEAPQDPQLLAPALDKSGNGFRIDTLCWLHSAAIYEIWHNRTNNCLQAVAVSPTLPFTRNSDLQNGL